MANNFNWVDETTLNGVLWDNGTLFSANPITQIGTLTISGVSSKILDAQLNNTGNIIDKSFSRLFIVDGYAINNSGNYELQEGGFESIGDSTFNNSGSFQKTTTGTSRFYVAFNNTGTVIVESGFLSLEEGGVSNNGIFNLNSGGTLQFERSAYILSNGAKINGNGNLTVGSGTLDIKLTGETAIANTVQLTLDRASGKLQVDGDWQLPTTTKWNGGTFKSKGILTNSGSLTISDVHRKYLDGQLNNTGEIVANFSLALRSNDGNLIFERGSTLNNFGNFVYQQGTTAFFNSAIINNSGNFEIQEGEILNLVTSVGTFNNSGTFKKTSGLLSDGTVNIEMAFNNTGTVSVESGSLGLLSGGVSNGGIFNLTSGTNLILGGAYILRNGAKINGRGNLTVNGSGLDLKLAAGTAIANTIQFTIDNGTFQVDRNWTLPTITNWNAGAIKTPGFITNNGSLNISNGGDFKRLDTQLDNTRTIVQNNARWWLIFNDAAILNNSGNYELQQGEIRNDNNSIGTFNNSGIFRKTTTGVGNIAVAFNNTGTVEARSGTLNFANTYTHDNANLILRGGTITFSNALTINGGSIEGNGIINVTNVGMTNAGLLNPRYASSTEFGRLTLNSNYTETDSARINIQLGGNTAGINFDQIDINGKATFDGTLNVGLLNGFIPTLGSTFDILTFDSLGNTSELDFTGLAINSTLQFAPQWSSNKLTLKVVEKVNAALAIAPTNASQTEGKSGNKAFSFTVTRTENTLATDSVNWAVTGIGINPANANDFGGTLPSGIVTFAPGQTTQLISVNVTGDMTQEANEQFRVTLSNPTNGAILTNPRAIGTILNDDIIGDNSNNILRGTANNDYLNGKGGNDILNGGAGADTLVGGLGNDTYVIDNIGDRIQETSTLATEVDTVQSSISYTLGANLERLTLTGTAAINGTGNALNNVLVGNSANNTLNAGLGRDTLTGGGGDDRLFLGNDTAIDTVNYTVGDGSDIVFNFVRRAGRDRLNFSGITAIDVRVLGSSTLFRVGDGITGNAGFGTGDLLVTTNGTKGFVAADVGVNLIGASFAFS